MAKKKFKDRAILFNYVGEEMTFKCKIGRQSHTNFLGGGLTGATLLLKNIRRYEDGMPIAEHLWTKLKEIVNFDQFHLCAGDEVVITGTPYSYFDESNYKGRIMPRYSIADINILRIVEA